jgi:hypothetical protein
MPSKLRKLKINRVDLVSAGANQESHVLLFKHDGGAPIAASDVYRNIQMHAEELVAAGWHQTMADAISAVCRQRPELYAAYRKSVSASTPVRIKS